MCALCQCTQAARQSHPAYTVWSHSGTLQNLETTLLRFLPRKVKDKIHRAMNDGVDEVFGKVSQEVRRLTMLLSAALTLYVLLRVRLGSAVADLELRYGLLALDSAFVRPGHGPAHATK